MATQSKPSLGAAVEIPKDEKIKLSVLVNSKEALQRLIEKELPVKTAFKLNRFIKAVEPELNNFEEQRVKLVKKYGKEDEKGNITVTSDNVEAFISELNDLLEIDVDIKFETISIDAFGDTTIPTKDIFLLDYLIKE